ncbi:permease [Candidatus Gracilibacteria bacterium]|nr:MAG: permease [Candidatus Gracilibacteria bacterium]PIE85648.1 MAG: permease [Candidatus Gracilibacteria bacterium]
MKNSSITTLNISILTLVTIVYILYIGSSLIIPFIIALLLSLAIISLSNFFQRKRINKIISFILSILTFGIIFIIVGNIINSNINEIIKLAPLYQEKFINILTPLFEYLDYFEIDTNILKEKILKNINVGYLIGAITSAVTSVLSITGIILFYIVFILLEHRYFSNKLENIFLNNSKKKNIISVLGHIKNDIKSYFVIKSITSFSTALLSYIVLTIFGADFALFWSFLIFLLNYIPTVGSIIAVSFPLLFTFVQFGFSISFTIIMVSLIGIQITMGNIIEPKFLGNKLNLSPLVIIISLGFWGSIWGIVGMLLSVPIMVIINIILSHFDSTRGIAIMLSEKGELNPDFNIIPIKTKKKGLRQLKDKIKSYYKK